MNPQPEQRLDPKVTPDASEIQHAVDEDKFARPQPTDEQHDIDSMAKPAGVEMPDREPLHIKDKMDERDSDRWQLDPDSKFER
ncbi:DUF6335 family protein [Lyngbya sp. CCY1209]|uniref:DUF6335 family protein n=1 Tax=Lyngbya sp. CCY1209 TaxID=2886103 RepID=UPI002D211FBF|nr:DUF6335 family protein [Lyngbya sp. CCY1209]MEB3883961.1 DUF6335 family protein [Lyngbya sp. CCY1209]